MTCSKPSLPRQDLNLQQGRQATAHEISWAPFKFWMNETELPFFNRPACKDTFGDDWSFLLLLCQDISKMTKNIIDYSHRLYSQRTCTMKQIQVLYSTVHTLKSTALNVHLLKIGAIANNFEVLCRQILETDRTNPIDQNIINLTFEVLNPLTIRLDNLYEQLTLFMSCPLETDLDSCKIF